MQDDAKASEGDDFGFISTLRALISSFIVTAVPVGLVLFGASDVSPYGDSIFNLMHSLQPVAMQRGHFVLAATVGSAVKLWLFDVHQWKTPLRFVPFTIFGILLVIGLLSYTLEVPSLPILVAMVAIPLLCYLTQQASFADHPAEYYGCAAISYSMVSFVVMSLWTLRCLSRHSDVDWLPDSVRSLSQRAAATELERMQRANGIESKVAAVAAPIVGAYLLLLAVLARLRSQQKDSMRTLALMIVMAAMLVYLTAPLCTIDPDLKLAVSRITLTFSTVLAISTVSMVDTQAVKGSSMTRHMLEVMQSDWLKAPAAIVLLVLLPPFLPLDMLHQAVRKIKDDPAPEGILTVGMSNFLAKLQRWHWTSVIMKLSLLQIIYLCLKIGAEQATTLFLSWLNAYLETVNLALVLVIYFFAGLFMFMLPPVPGVPIYVATGVIVGNALLKTGWTLWQAGTFCAVYGTLLKLAGSACQQKLIGEPFSASVYIRKTVGVNTVFVRAIERILLEPGISLKKVAICLGGPDWPTSVLAGILRQSVPGMMLCTLPCFFLVAPSVLTGIIMVLDESSEDAKRLRSMATPIVGLAALGQAISVMLATYFILEIADKNHDALMAPREADADVEKLAAEHQRREQVFRRITEWSMLPCIIKPVVLLGVLSASASNALVLDVSDAIVGEGCFKDFGLTDSIAQKLDGKPWSIVLRPGWYALGLLAAAISSWRLFELWASCKVWMTLPTDGDGDETTEAAAGDALLDNAGTPGGQEPSRAAAIAEGTQALEAGASPGDAADKGQESDSAS
eukprot:TRINITY_DN37912_c0_g1_i1.p1 TRINITY_DN37912_c0_g1~~TRINITY_DN37912_c0_g1_i1.p1  ORF type:complete len:793 (-),score=168.18 TRINITY_DN37912_c0_g1_i1:28-2406(-)